MNISERISTALTRLKQCNTAVPTKIIVGAKEAEQLSSFLTTLLEKPTTVQTHDTVYLDGFGGLLLVVVEAEPTLLAFEFPS